MERIRNLHRPRASRKNAHSQRLRLVPDPSEHREELRSCHDRLMRAHVAYQTVDKSAVCRLRHGSPNARARPLKVIDAELDAVGVSEVEFD